MGELLAQGQQALPLAETVMMPLFPQFFVWPAMGVPASAILTPEIITPRMAGGAYTPSFSRRRRTCRMLFSDFVLSCPVLMDDPSLANLYSEMVRKEEIDVKSLDKTVHYTEVTRRIKVIKVTI